MDPFRLADQFQRRIQINDGPERLRLLRLLVRCQRAVFQTKQTGAKKFRNHFVHHVGDCVNVDGTYTTSNVAANVIAEASEQIRDLRILGPRHWRHYG